MRSILVLGVAAIGSTAFAQDLEKSGGAKALRKSDMLVPIHTQSADPAGGEYGTWAAGPDYKASFHSGPDFYPFLGPTYAENLPLRFRTTSIKLGANELLVDGASPEHKSSPWRYEYVRAGVTEAYDVREAGIEQTFTLPTRPAGAGDLVVTMRVDTKLSADAVENQHVAVTFRDAKGNDLVRYGEGTAFDAAGRKSALLTSWNGENLSLRLSAAFLADATYPVVLDPLVTRVSIATSGAATYGLSTNSEVGRDDESTTTNIMTFYSRQFSATDFDGYARLSNDDFGASTLVYTDVTTSWSTTRAGVAFCGGADRWALCLQRDFTSNAGVRVYFHAKANTTLNSGSTYFHSIPSGDTHRYPEIGGTAGFSAGTNVLLVYQADTTTTSQNTANSRVHGVLVDAVALTAGSVLDLDAIAGNDDCEFPVVNQESDGGTTSWAIAYQRRDNTLVNDDWDLYTNLVSSTGTLKTAVFQGPATSSPAHKIRPQISGRQGRYVVTYLLSGSLSSDYGQGIYAARFDWAASAAAPTKIAIREIASDDANQNFVNGGVAYDNVTQSHWGVVYQRGPYASGRIYAARLGYTGGVTETGTCYSGPNGAYSSSIAFNDDTRKFVIVYGSTDNPPSGYPVYGQEFVYATDAINVSYGTGCGGSMSAGRPFAGSEFFTVGMSGGAANQPCALLFGAAPAAIDLTPAGMPSCFLNVGPVVASLSDVTAANGSSGFTFALPDAPVAIGDVYVQYVHVDPNAPWALKIRTTAGLRIQVR